MSVPVNAGNSWEDNRLRSVFGQAFSKRLMRRGPALAKLKNR